MTDQLQAAMKAINELVRTSPTIEVEHYNDRGTLTDTTQKPLVSFGYIGNLSFGRDDRRFLVFDQTTQYMKSSSGKFFWKGRIKNAAEEPWGCESNELTIEALRDAWKAVKAAIERAKEMVA